MALAEFKRWFGRRRKAPHVEPLLAEPVPPVRHDAANPASVWTPGRLAVEEELWGTGYLTPGDAPELLRLSVPLGLSEASSLLVLGVGVGGAPQTLATDLGVWIGGFESDPVLAAIAAQRLQRAGVALAKRPSVEAWDAATPAFRPKFYHHALLLDAIQAGVPARVLAAVDTALKPHGQVVMVQTVAERPLDPDDPDIAA